MNLTRILSVVFAVIALALAYYLYNNINSTIQFQNNITDAERQIKDKLAIIRESEKAYLEYYGTYTSNWDSLINFIENVNVPIVVRSEKITQQAYGEEKVEVILDTVGYTPAKDKIFKKSFAVNATSDLTFLGYEVKVGDFVAKRSKGYRYRAGSKEDVYTFTDEGYISSITNIAPGTTVTRGQNLINLWNYHLNHRVDIKTLKYVPGSETLEGQNGQPLVFDIFAGKIERGGLKVSVIEVKDPKPLDPTRKETNEAKNKKPLGFGSKNDVTTSGNWE